jgi:sulfate/thiosulfate transport system permease protein
MTKAKRRVLPGFGLTMGYTLAYLSLIALIPLSSILLKTEGMGWVRFWHVVLFVGLPDASVLHL